MKRDVSRTPPKPAPGLIVGITGHRRLPAGAAGPLGAAIEGVLADLGAAAVRTAQAHPDVFRAADPRLVLISPLAEGADQIAAEAALRHGWALRAVLPFAPEEYAKDFEGEPRHRFDTLLARTEAWWSLPGERGHAEEGYALAGQVTVAQADVMIAIWDGRSARGLGGTADVIEQAIRRGVPVIWIGADGATEPVVLWGGFDELAPALLDRTTAPRRPLDPSVLERVVAAVMAPPAAPEEFEALRLYLGERQRRWRWRQEYPFLLALTGARGWRAGQLRARDYAKAAKADWAAFRAHPAAADPALSPGLDRLEAAFGWADGLADHYAQTYRSGFVFNYTAAATAVLIALSGFIWPQFKVQLLFAELGVLGLLIGNTTAGGRRQWHRRWLSYRYLAERLRPMRSLALFSAASPTFNGARGGEAPWMDWYAAALWRDMGARPTLATPEAVRDAARHVAKTDVRDQIAYHGVNAHRMHHVEHTLHVVGGRLFEATAVLAIVALVGILAAFKPVKNLVPLITVLTAGLPTVGSALFGMRGQGDFVGAEGRSEATAARLEAPARRLEADDVDLAVAARATEDAAATMLAELDEWRLSYRHRKLAIPA